MKIANSRCALSCGSAEICQLDFLAREELEVKAIVDQNLATLSPLWSSIDRAILRFLGDLFPVGPMKNGEVLTLLIAYDHREKVRKPCEIFSAVKTEEIQSGDIWSLVWLLARVRMNLELWQRFNGTVALGSPVSDGWSGRKFPYLNGSHSEPSIRLVSEESIGDPNRRFKFLGRPVSAPHLRMNKSSVS